MQLPPGASVQGRTACCRVPGRQDRRGKGIPTPARGRAEKLVGFCFAFPSLKIGRPGLPLPMLPGQVPGLPLCEQGETGSRVAGIWGKDGGHQMLLLEVQQEWVEAGGSPAPWLSTSPGGNLLCGDSEPTGKRGESLIFLLAGHQPAPFPKPTPGAPSQGTFRILSSRSASSSPASVLHPSPQSLVAAFWLSPWPGTPGGSQGPGETSSFSPTDLPRPEHRLPPR